MLREVGSWFVGGPERCVLGDTSALDNIPVVVEEVAILGIFEDLPRSCVFLADVGRGIHPPEIVKDGLVEPIVNNGQTEIFHVLVKFGLGDGVAAGRAVQLLDDEDGLLNFLPDVFLVLAAVLNVGVVAEVDYLLNFSEIGGLLRQSDLIPEPIQELLPVFRHFAPDGEDELREADEVGALLIENVENMVDFSIGDVDSLLFDYLLELLVVEKGIPVNIS